MSIDGVDPRAPVLVGVGSCLDDAEAVELMARAALAAGEDCGAPALLREVQRIVVPKGTWSYTDPGRIVGERIGAPDAHRVLVELGIPQQTPIDDALADIVAGRVDVVLVVGGEAKARAARLAQQATKADREGIVAVARRGGTAEAVATETDQGGAEPDEVQRPTGDIVDRAEIEAGLWAPVEQYALMESALRAAERRSIDAHRREVAELWSRMSAVAATNPEAAFPTPKTVEDLVEFGPAQRPLAFPYGKWHASQWTVDQAAALLLCSAATAERLGVPRDRWVIPLVGVESSWMLPLSRRAQMHRWPAMRVLGQAAEARLGRPLATCEHVEVYSCFPVAVRVQQRELGLPVDGTPTITGGMAFAGGPFNSFVLQATVAMARRLREQGGTGLVTTVSGFLTKPGLAVWSAEPDGELPLVADLAEDAAAATEARVVLPAWDGEATIAAVTVGYEGAEPAELVAILDTSDGTRLVAKSRDVELATRATTEELVGRVAQVAGNVVVAVG